MPAPVGRILFISPQPFFQWRGSPIRVAFGVRALAELGYAVDLLTLPIGERLDIPGVRVLRVANMLRATDLAIGPSAMKAFFDVLLLARGMGLALTRRYVAVHGIEDAGAVGAAIAAVARLPLVFEKHSDPASYRGGALRNLVMRAYAAAERLAIRRAAAVIGTGEGLVAQARACRPGVAAHHIPDIPSSLAEAEPAKTAMVRASLLRAPDECIAMYVGSFAVYQGINLMFEAMPQVAVAAPRVRFAVIGGSPGEIEQRRRWLAARGVEDRVTFVGKVPPDELPNYLAAADILLSPRTAGANTPLKLLDYLKAGRAIVATDHASNRLILSAATALLVPADPREFARGIARLALDAPERGRLQNAGRELIASTCNYEEFKRRLARCYEGVTAR